MKTIQGFATDIINFINGSLVPLVFAVAFIFFLYGVFRYFISGAASDEKRTEGRKYIMWAIIGFAVMISVWGLVNVLVNTFGFDSNSRPCLPTFAGGCSSSSSSGGTGGSANTHGDIFAPDPTPQDPNADRINPDPGSSGIY